ncbi:hypothetical protein D9M73_238430 [compost metagenome]
MAGEVEVGAVLENDRHLGQPGAGQRACLLQLRQPGHHRLDRIGDALLGLQRRVAGSGGVDLYLDVGDVRDGVDGQLLVAGDADARHAQHGEQHDETLLDGEADDAFEHG